MSQNEPAFKVEFSCSNCGNTWSEKFGKKEKVKEKTFGRHPVRVHPQGKSDNRSRAIWCPVCELAENVKVVNRKPA